MTMKIRLPEERKLSEEEKLMRRIEFAARIYLCPEALERFNYLKHVHRKRYILIGLYLLQLLERYGMDPKRQITLKEFKEIARRFNPPSRRWGRIVA